MISRQLKKIDAVSVKMSHLFLVEYLSGSSQGGADIFTTLSH
jgi:hypothetical protein